MLSAFKGLSSDSTHVQSKQDRLKDMCYKIRGVDQTFNSMQVNVLPPCVERCLGAIAVGHQEVGIVVQDKVFCYMPRRVND